MPLLLNVTFGFVTLLISLPVNANNIDHTSVPVISEYQLEWLAHQPAWLKLLHHHQNSLTGRYDSYVDDAHFFYARDGKHNPKEEMKATLQAFSDTGNDDDSRAICRFPARFSWLTRELGLDARQFPTVDCSAYHQWRNEVNAAGISLIFASAYLNSPSSMFGHTLLRLDSKPGIDHSDWLSYALNFGAIVSEVDNSALYAFKGLAGGYPGLFQLMPFFKKIQEYNFMENRDLWEYKLNLSEAETDRLLTHLWELRDIHFDYYYVSENCSFRLLELLEIARPGSHLTESFTLTAIPSEIIRTINENGFIASVRYRPSQATQLKHQIERIPENYHSLIEKLSKDLTTVERPDFEKASPALQKQMISTAYQWLRYQTAGTKRSAPSAKRRFKLLTLLNRYPADTVQSSFSVPTAPETGHSTHRLALSGGYSDNEAFAELSYRQNYHDLLDNPNGYFTGSAIEFFNLNVRVYEDNRFRLQKLELLNIASLSPRNRFFKPVSWRLAAGVGYQDYGEDKLSVYLNGGGGFSYSWFDGGLGYALINAHLEHNDNFDYPLQPGLGFTLGQLYYSGLGASRLEFDSKVFIDGTYLYQAGLEHNFVIARNHAVRISVKQQWNKYEDFNQTQVSYQFYF